MLDLLIRFPETFPPGIEENFVYTKQTHLSAERCVVDQSLQVFGYQLLG